MDGAKDDLDLSRQRRKSKQNWQSKSMAIDLEIGSGKADDLRTKTGVVDVQSLKQARDLFAFLEESYNRHQNHLTMTLIEAESVYKH